jgi:2'-5' RNA ligase
MQLIMYKAKVREVFINIVIYLVITVNSDVTYVFVHLYQGELHYINVRENRRCNHEWTFQKHLPFWLHITLVEDKQSKKHNTEN